MPAKQRIAKTRVFDDYRRQQLLEGPDACLLAGVGYLARISEPTFDRATWIATAAALPGTSGSSVAEGADRLRPAIAVVSRVCSAAESRAKSAWYPAASF